MVGRGCEGILFTSIPLDQEDCQPLEEVPDGLVLIFPCGPGLGPCQLLDLEDSLRVPASQCLNREWNEGNAFPLTGCQVIYALVIKRACQSVARTGDRVGQSVREQGAQYCHIKSSILQLGADLPHQLWGSSEPWKRILLKTFSYLKYHNRRSSCKNRICVRTTYTAHTMLLEMGSH